jgi:hypothetical protein
MALGLKFDGVQYVLDDINVSNIEIVTSNDNQFQVMLNRITTEILRRQKLESVKKWQGRNGNVCVIFTLQDARDLAAYAECECDITERPEYFCIRCATHKALYDLTGEECYQLDPRGAKGDDNK